MVLGFWMHVCRAGMGVNSTFREWEHSRVPEMKPSQYGSGKTRNANWPWRKRLAVIWINKEKEKSGQWFYHTRPSKFSWLFKPRTGETQTIFSLIGTNLKVGFIFSGWNSFWEVTCNWKISFYPRKVGGSNEFYNEIM